MTVEELITLCEPGKHFLGLWTVNIKKLHGHTVLWTVTFLDLKNVYGETNCYQTPLRALQACAKFLKRLPAVRKVPVRRGRRA